MQIETYIDSLVSYAMNTGLAEPCDRIPHDDKHNIKQEDIGLIEVMGLAVLPSRLKGELSALKDSILAGAYLRADSVLEKHANWIDGVKTRRTFTEENAMDILLEETGRVFAAVLEDAGVYKCTEEGRDQFTGFISCVNQEGQI